jgi:hypothetical protein
MRGEYAVTRRLVLLFLLICWVPAQAVIWDINFQSNTPGAASGTGTIDFTDTPFATSLSAFNFDGILLGNSFNFSLGDLNNGVIYTPHYDLTGTMDDILSLTINQLYFSVVSGSENRLVETLYSDMLAGLSLFKNGSTYNAEIQCVSLQASLCPKFSNIIDPNADNYDSHTETHFIGSWSLSLHDDSSGPPSTNVSEPSSLILMLLGISGLALVTVRRRTRAVSTRQIRSKEPLNKIWQLFCAKVQGHIRYYGVSFNLRSVSKFVYQALRILYKWLNRRSQRRSFTWETFRGYVEANPLPRIAVYHSLYGKVQRCEQLCLEPIA